MTGSNMQQQATETQAMQAPQLTGGNSKKWMLIVAIVIALVLIAVVALVVGMSNQNEPEPTPPVNEQSADDYSNLDAEETVDQVVDEVNQELDGLDTPEDYEDFDSELEFGVKE